MKRVVRTSFMMLIMFAMQLCMAGKMEDYGGFKARDYNKKDVQVLDYAALDTTTKQTYIDAARMAETSYPDYRNSAWKETGYTDVASDAKLSEIAGYAGLNTYDQHIRSYDSKGKIVDTYNANDKSTYFTAITGDNVTDSDATRLSVRVFEKRDTSGRVVEVGVSYCGTDWGNKDPHGMLWDKTARDAVDDGQQILPLLPTPQPYKDGAKVLEGVIKAYPDADIKVYGHSEGGGEAMYAVLSSGVKTDNGHTIQYYGVNSAGLNGLKTNGVINPSLTKEDIENNFTLIQNEGEWCSPNAYQFGKVVEVGDANISGLTQRYEKLSDEEKKKLEDNKKKTTYDGKHGVEETIAKMEEVKKNENSKPSVASTQDSDADMTGSTTPSAESSLERLAEQLLKEHQNGESNVLPEDFFNDVFKNTLGEPKKNTDIAQTAYDDKISTLIEDKTVAQKVKDFVKGEIDKVVAKGEEWVENGGIRDAIKKGLDKILDGKVSDAQMQEILNLTDGLCNVNKDGGTSLIAALKTDGKDLAVSLAINELEKQLSNALPEDVAGTLNSMLDVIADKGTAKDVRDSLLLEAQKLVSKYVPYDNSVKTINGVLQDIIDGNAIDAMDTVKGLGVSVGADALKDVLSKNLPPEVADRINGLLDGFAQNGAQGLTDAAKNEIYGLIDQYAPGGDSAKQLKNVIDGVISGSVTGNDLKDAATSIVGDGAKGLINNSNLPQDVKNAANAAIDGLMQNGLTGLTTNARDFISDYVADYLGDAAAGDAVGKIFDAVVTPGVDPWQEIGNQAPVIGAAIGHKVVAEVEKFAAAQIDKLIAKCPALQKVLNKLGINGAGIINGVKNVFSVLKNAPDLQTALTKLGDMAVNFLKDIAGKLIDWALEWAISWINNNVIPKVVDWASETLAKMAGSTNNELLQKGLAWLSDQVKNCKKCAAIKIKVDVPGAKIVDKVDQWIKSKQSTTTTVLQTNGGKK